MKSLSQVLNRLTDTGAKLPEMSPALTRAGIRPRRGQVTMIAGPPNGGKSLLALWYSLTAQIPTLYFSADTDAFTTLLRASAMVTGDKVDEVEEALLNPAGEEHYAAVLADGAPFLKFSFEPSPSLDDIDMEIRAYEEMMGTPPELIVIDNLMNVQAEHDNEFTGMREISKVLHHVARESQAGVLVLHHTSEADGPPGRPASRKAIMGKINQLPEMILTIATEPEKGLMHVSIVKNRSGTHDPTAKQFLTLYVDLPRMSIFDTQQQAAISQFRGEIE